MRRRMAALLVKLGHMQDAFFGGNAIIADDRQVIRDAVRSALGDTWCVFPARNGVEAVVYARSMQAALLVLDINMEPGNGIDASAEIRALPGYANVPIVILTAFDNEVNRRNAELAGVDTIITKPFTAQNLLAVIRPLIAARRDGAALPPESYRQSEPQHVLAIYRKVDAVATHDPYNGFVAWTKARRKDSIR
jgi:two-component system chemotaxis response regulator CheY